MLSRYKIGDIRKVLAATSITVGLNLATNSPSSAIDAIDAAFRNSAITYSNNAKNIQRIGQGDYSQGSEILYLYACKYMHAYSYVILSDQRNLLGFFTSDDKLI